MTHLLIPTPVVQHWQPKYDDLVTHGHVQASDATYAKIAAARSQRTVIEADHADLAEIVAECDFVLGSGSEDIAEIPSLRAAYRRLRRSAKSALDKETLSLATA